MAFLARISVADEPLLADVTCVRITSTHGVIRLKGRVAQASDKGRIEATIRDALATAGLPYSGLVNALQARKAGPENRSTSRPLAQTARLMHSQAAG